MINESYNFSLSVHGFLKKDFKFDHSHTRSYIGCITDGYFKLEIRIMDVDRGLYYEKGQHIELTGQLISTGKKICVNL